MIVHERVHVHRCFAGSILFCLHVISVGILVPEMGSYLFLQSNLYSLHRYFLFLFFLKTLLHLAEQMLKKDDNINRLQSDLQESTKELTVVRGILPKISEERDLMWKEVKQYNERNMLLYSEVGMLKKKVEALDEELLIKEGQITILKDTIGSRPFDILGSPDSSREFLLQ